VRYFRALRRGTHNYVIIIKVQSQSKFQSNADGNVYLMRWEDLIIRLICKEIMEIVTYTQKC